MLYDFCKCNDVEIYFVNRLSIVSNEYLNVLVKTKEIKAAELLEMLVNEKSCYNEFIGGKEKEDFNYYEKLIYHKVMEEK